MSLEEDMRQSAAARARRENAERETANEIGARIHDVQRLLNELGAEVAEICRTQNRPQYVEAIVDMGFMEHWRVRNIGRRLWSVGPALLGEDGLFYTGSTQIQTSLIPPLQRGYDRAVVRGRRQHNAVDFVRYVTPVSVSATVRPGNEYRGNVVGLVDGTLYMDGLPRPLQYEIADALSR
ncbi:hypothetical protein [Cryobacterium sp. Hb1]|uniref:hypothetical protein n=1 Tax=Cryobacterium sp. Hb1 TaxID=1259147 RepID=UPI00106D8316|nr:hypothetical protein [Cryobacterium sp. Hb1]TFD72128.1 hypothetical protein E3T38_01130 [Cryobacterium sp. Hb1]